MSIIQDELSRIMLAGIGAIANSNEKARALVDGWVAKGEITVERGKVLNEELKRNVKAQFDNAFAPSKVTVEDLEKKASLLSKEEKAELIKKLSAETEEAEETEVKEAEVKEAEVKEAEVKEAEVKEAEVKEAE